MLPAIASATSLYQTNGAGKTALNRFLRERAEAFQFVTPDAASSPGGRGSQDAE